jgi:hypothetical protein
MHTAFLLKPNHLLQTAHDLLQTAHTLKLNNRWRITALLVATVLDNKRTFGRLLQEGNIAHRRYLAVHTLQLAEELHLLRYFVAVTRYLMQELLLLTTCTLDLTVLQIAQLLQHVLEKDIDLHLVVQETLLDAALLKDEFLQQLPVLTQTLFYTHATVL